MLINQKKIHIQFYYCCQILVGVVCFERNMFRRHTEPNYVFLCLEKYLKIIEAYNCKTQKLMMSLFYFFLKSYNIYFFRRSRMP